MMGPVLIGGRSDRSSAPLSDADFIIDNNDFSRHKILASVPDSQIASTQCVVHEGLASALLNAALM